MGRQYKFISFILNDIHRLLEDETNIHKKLESIQNLVKKFVPVTSIMDIDKKLLQYLMPAIKTLLCDIFNEICQTLQSSLQKEKSVETLNILQEYLQVCLTIFEEVGTILSYILNNKDVDLCYVQSVPLNLVQILHISFQHCKDSTGLYKSYLDDLKEIILLFRGAQEIHMKLLKLLEEHVSVNALVQEEVRLVNDVLDVLREIGEVLVDMNVKALADNWKGYMTLAQKFADILRMGSYNIDKSFKFLSLEIVKNINNVLNLVCCVYLPKLILNFRRPYRLLINLTFLPIWYNSLCRNVIRMLFIENSSEVKSTTQTLKITNFFVRVALKLCDIFWSNIDNISSSILEFFICIYEFYPPSLISRKYGDNLTDQINSAIFICTDPLLNKLLHEEEFIKALSKIKNTESSGLLFVLSAIFEELPAVIRNNQQMVKSCQFVEVIRIYFEVVQQNYSNFFCDICKDNKSLYNQNVANIASTILLLNRVQYCQIEIILLKNIFKNPIWCPLLAMDIWYMVLRQKNPKLCYESLHNLIEKTSVLFQDSLTNSPETVFLGIFLRKLYNNLPENYKKLIVSKHPPNFLNVHIWKILSFKNFPVEQNYIIESLLINIMEKIESFNNGKCTFSDFNLLCTSLEVISSLPQNSSVNVKHMLSLIISLWNFEIDGNFKENAFSKLLVTSLCQVTNNFIMQFSNEELLLVFTKLKQLLRANFNVKIQTNQILYSLATRSFPYSPDQNQTMLVIAEVFNILLQDQNPIIRENTLEVFFHVLNSTSHEEIVQNAIKNEKQLQRRVSNFIKRNIEDKAKIDLNRYFEIQQTYEFLHKCPNFQPVKQVSAHMDQSDIGSAQKRPKMDDTEISIVVKRITSDIELLHRLCGKENVLRENVAEIINVLSRQVNYKF